jgi:hypothetical protein
LDRRLPASRRKSLKNNARDPKTKKGRPVDKGGSAAERPLVSYRQNF